MVNVGIFYAHLEPFIAIWYNFWPFGVKNLATLMVGNM
jgi:hypothetical protein